MVSTPEGRVKDVIKEWYKKHSIPYWMIIPSPMGGTVGFADFLSILPNGVFMVIEAKRAGGKKNVTVNQQKFLNTINDNKGYGFVVDSVDDLEMIETSLKEKGIL